MKIDTIPMSAGVRRYGCDLDVADPVAVGEFEKTFGAIDRDALNAFIRERAASAITAYAERAGAQLVAGLTPRRVAEYQIKASIAADPSTASEEELALFDRMAAARGIDREDLLDRIAARAKDYRETALLISTMEDESWAALEAIPDDANTAIAVDALLLQLEAGGEQAIAAARAAIQGDA